jgi:hypothetical protein
VLELNSEKTSLRLLNDVSHIPEELVS